MIETLEKFPNIDLSEDKTRLYANVDGLSLQNLFYSENGYFPSCQLFDCDERSRSEYYFDTKAMSEHLLNVAYKDHNPVCVYYLTKKFGNDNPIDAMGFCIIIKDLNIYARFEKNLYESYVLFDNKKWDELTKFMDIVCKFFVSPEDSEDTYYRICTSQNGFYLKKGNVKYPKNFDVKKSYNDDFEHEDEKIRAFIEEDNKSGLVILHGEMGTGKSTYIAHLIHSFPKKRFVIIPPDMVGYLGDAAFGSFLETLDNHVIIIEDCENAIRDRKSGRVSANSVSTILNLTDGIMSNDLSMKFICTFNEDMKNIDPALLRKGRLVCKYEFKPLEIEKAKTLLEEQGIYDAIVNKPMPVCDIFHYGDDSYTNNINPII